MAQTSQLSLASTVRRCAVELPGALPILSQLTRQQLILRYRRTLLGYFWTLFNPLLMMGVTAVVFSTLFNVGLRDFVIFLFPAMICFNFFSNTVVQGSKSLISNEGLLKKIYIPKLLFPTSVALSTLVDSAVTFFILMLLVLAIGGEISPALISIPLAFVLVFLFALGVSLVLSIATAYFRDIEHIVTIGMQALFFLSPILYDKKILSENLELITWLNPLIAYIDLFRSPIYLAQWPAADSFITAILLAAFSLLVGLAFFCSHQAKVIFRL